ncbi:MAG: hypothetical protein KC731_10655 [Myxococcales bacterium]|nr:hypothetical protein [Myxococcales bacterium]
MNSKTIGIAMAMSTLLAVTGAQAQEEPTAAPTESIRSPHALGWGIGLSTIGTVTGIFGAVMIGDAEANACVSDSAFADLGCGLGRFAGGVAIGIGVAHLAVGIPLIVWGSGEPDEPEIQLNAGLSSTSLSMRF